MKVMVAKIKKYLDILLYLQKLSIMKRMAYPGSFISLIFTVVFAMSLNLLFIKVNFSYIQSIAGWNYYQVLVVVGSYLIVEGIMWGMARQLNNINRHIISGTLDGLLLKPTDSQFLVSFWGGDIEDYSRTIIGIFLIYFAIQNLAGFNFVKLFIFIILLVNGLVTLYSFNLFIRCFSFWIIDGSGLWLLIERLTSNTQYPTDIYYQKYIRNFFTFVIPLAFVATVPAKILTNVKIDWKLVFLAMLMGTTFFILSRMFWKFSLKRYSSASS